MRTTRVWQTGDRLMLLYREWNTPAEIMLASQNGRSLMLRFDAVLGKHAGAMPVLQGDDGTYLTIVTGEAIRLEPIQ